MSLDDSQQKNMKITPIGNFKDGMEYGLTNTGELVHISETSTWAGIFKNGLSVNKQLESRVRDVETVIQTTNTKNIQLKTYYSNSPLHETEYKKVKQNSKHTTSRLSSCKQLKKTARSRRKKTWSREKPPQVVEDKPAQLCNCDQCNENNTCNCCGKLAYGDIKHYNSIFSSIGTWMCHLCAKDECCRSCGWESGGEYCRYCRSSL